MDTGKIISLVGFSIIFIYIIIQILKFYSVDTNVYGVYITFYLFILLSTMVLPMSYPHLVSN